MWVEKGFLSTLALFALVGLSLASFAAADSNSTSSPQTAMLEAQLQHAQCTSDFTTGVLNSIESQVTINPPDAMGVYHDNNVSNSITVTPPDGIKQSLIKLEADVTQLQQYANSGDAQDFKTFLRTTFDPDLKTARFAVASERGKGKLTQDQRATLRTQYDSLRDAFANCESNALKNFAQNRLVHYQEVLADYDARATRLSNYGIDTTALHAIVRDARTQIYVPLQNAIASANDSRTLKNAFEQYCLFDGCKLGINFHLEAKFEIEKLSEILAFLQPNATTGNLTSEITAVQADLANAKSSLAVVGNGVYSDSSRSAVGDSIKAAAEGLKTILIDLRRAV